MAKINLPVVLASGSPRRQELLKQFFAEFKVDPADIDEESLIMANPAQTAQKLAKEKALVVSERHPESLVIAGDTIVALGEHDGAEQLAKPSDEADAIRMISTLAGRTHVVITGIALRWPTGFIAFTDVSKVTFKKLTEKQIADYVATGESMDKAGAYGIQGMASTLVERIEGSVNNIIGLPTERLEEALRNVH
jgi:septum formation protein